MWIFERVPGELWAVSPDSMYRKSRERWEAISTPLENGERFWGVVPVSGGRRYVVTSIRQMLFDGARFEPEKVPARSWDALYFQLYPGLNGEAWFNGRAGLLRRRTEQWEVAIGCPEPLTVGTLTWGKHYGLLGVRGLRRSRKMTHPCAPKLDHQSAPISRHLRRVWARGSRRRRADENVDR